MIRTIACIAAALSLTAGTVSAEIYNPAVPGVTSGVPGGPVCNAFPAPCNTIPMSIPGSCPTSFCENCPIPGGITVDGMCPTCPSACPTSFCPTMNSCDSCLPGCNMSWCIKTKICCRDNPCQMPPHYAYKPACHGYYYFAPYNYQTALQHKEYARYQNLDPRFPYAVPTFEHTYQQVIGDRELASAGDDLVLPAKGLPNLEDLIRDSQ